MTNQQVQAAPSLLAHSRPAPAVAVKPARPVLAATPDRHSARTDIPVALALAGDTGVILLSQALAFWLRFRSGWFAVDPEAAPMLFLEYMRLIVVGTTLLLFTFAHLRVYYARNLLNFTAAGNAILRGTAVWVFAFLAISLALDFQPPISRLFALLSYFGCVLFLLPWRWVYSRILQQECHLRNFRRRVLLVGWNRDADRMAAAIRADKHHVYEIIGCVTSPTGKFQSQPPERTSQLGAYTDLGRILEREQVDVVVLTDLRLVMEDLVSLANLCERQYVEFKVVPTYFPLAMTRLHLETISSVPILGALPQETDNSLLRWLKIADR